MKNYFAIKHASQGLKTIFTRTNNLTDMFFDEDFYLDPCAYIDLQLMRSQPLKCSVQGQLKCDNSDINTVTYLFFCSLPQFSRSHCVFSFFLNTIFQEISKFAPFVLWITQFSPFVLWIPQFAPFVIQTPLMVKPFGTKTAKKSAPSRQKLHSTDAQLNLFSSSLRSEIVAYTNVSSVILAEKPKLRLQSHYQVSFSLLIFIYN